MSVKYDVVIIGSGFGGLIAGALLSKNGLKVAILEQHDKVGGFASHFKRKGYTFEVAVHLMDGPSKNNFRTNIFDYLDIESKIDFAPIKNFFAVHLNKGMVEVPANIAAAREVLSQKFPSETQGIQIFFDSMERISDQFADFLRREPSVRLSDPFFNILYPDFHELSRVTIAEYIYSLVKNNDLRWILLANLGFYYHDLNFPASAYLVNQANYLNGGVRYVRGGVQNASNVIADLIKNFGGEIHLKSSVEKINVVNNRATGVVAKKTHGTEREAMHFDSKYVIANAAVPYVYDFLLGDSYSKDPIIYPPGATQSISATTCYLGIKKPYHELTESSFFNFYRDNESFSGYGGAGRGADFSLVDYSVVDDTYSKVGRSTADMVFLDKVERWDQAFQRGQYNEAKTKMISQVKAWLQKLNPDFLQYLEVVELATPRTVERFTRNSLGAIYGFNASTMDLDLYCDRLRLNFVPRDQNIKNLYFASAWSSCQSISGVTTAGYQAARSILEVENIELKI